MSKLCVDKCVSKLCGDKLCVCVQVVCVSKRGAAERRGQAGPGGARRGRAEVHNQKQEPHTKMWGKRI